MSTSMPELLAVVEIRNSAVSRPSRATATKATMPRAKADS